MWSETCLRVVSECRQRLRYGEHADATSRGEVEPQRAADSFRRHRRPLSLTGASSLSPPLSPPLSLFASDFKLSLSHQTKYPLNIQGCPLTQNAPAGCKRCPVSGCGGGIGGGSSDGVEEAAAPRCHHVEMAVSQRHGQDPIPHTLIPPAFQRLQRGPGTGASPPAPPPAPLLAAQHP